jgi:UDP-glucuronate 4-epimerase
MKILLTGCAGFIGSTLAARLLDEGYEVIGLDMFTPNYERWIKERNLEPILQHPRFRFQQTDLRTADFHHLLQGIDILFHQAALPGVRTSWGPQFREYVEHNILVTQALLDAATNSNIRKLIYASSSSVYGGMSGPTDETKPAIPYSPYGVSKLAAEQLCQVYARNFGLPVVMLRYFTVYGPRQRPDMAFHLFIRKILLGQPISLFGDGEQTRDFTFIEDAIQANLEAMHTPYNGEVFNIGGHSRASLNEVIRLIESRTGCSAHIQYLAEQPGDPRHTWADIDKARRLLNYSPQYELEKGIHLQVQDIKKLYRI